jgi:Rieske Fe-S protein
MDRTTFIIRCAACLGLPGLAGVLNGCTATKYIDAGIEGSDLTLPLTAFEEIDKGGEKKLHNYIVAQNEKLEYPISVFRLADNNYTALLMRCTHQGTELQVFGDRLQCPAHGSEFTNRGVVVNGPADTNLRIFPVRIDGGNIKVSLS